jgi:hypothetical protein
MTRPKRSSAGGGTDAERADDFVGAEEGVWSQRQVRDRIQDLPDRTPSIAGSITLISLAIYIASFSGDGWQPFRRSHQKRSGTVVW